MPDARPRLTVDDVHRFVDERCLAPRAEGRVGVEVEWLPVRLDDPAGPPVDDYLDLARREPAPAGSRLTFEPGGQIELSSPPLQGIGPACAALAADAAALGGTLAGAGVGLVGLGFDPRPSATRRVHSPRYDAMEAYFDTQCADGRTMMRSTAAVQVNVDVGSAEATVDRRWHRAHDLGPTLAAAFANSPLGADGPSGWRSRRLAVWHAIDAGRTRSADVRGSAPDAWARYALDACVMMIRRDESVFVPLLEPLSFEAWIEVGHELGYPTLADFEYHLTTLFPPVRPRGWLELRMIDSLPDPWWRAAVAVATTLIVDDDSAAAVAREVATARDLWAEAARHGLGHPALAASARICLETALEALSRLGTDATTIAAVAAFHERYTARGRCPADDRLAEWTEHGSLLPTPDRFLELTWV